MKKIKFKSFIRSIKKIVNDKTNGSKHSFKEILTLDKDSNIVTLTFGDWEEKTVDKIARKARDSMLKKYESNGHTFSITKQHIASHGYWDLTFTFGEKYKFTEWYGA